ncbi:MAG: ROK family protein [Oscillospiraceae bacterium]|nr:ROK family protein [Oscillospiraceae bacterium]
MGGTNIAAAVVDKSGAVLSRASLPTPRGVGAQAVASAMARAAQDAYEQGGFTLSDIASVGVGSPGTVDPEQGLIRRWYKMGFENVPITALLARALPKPIFLENDANCAALGEYAAGAGRDVRSLVAITLGTGVGGGVVLDGSIYTGFQHAGMEPGHMVVAHGGRLCACGRRGCLEAYASASALITRTREVLGLAQADGKTAFLEAKQGNPLAMQVVEEYISYLACGIVNLVNLFQPELVCLGGGVAEQGERLLTPLQDILARENYARGLPQRTRLVQAALGNDAGILGAALLPFYSHVSTGSYSLSQGS